jgi:hypothetical protein
MRPGTMASSPCISPAAWRDRSVSCRCFVVTKLKIVVLSYSNPLVRYKAPSCMSTGLNETKCMHPLGWNGSKLFNVNIFTFDSINYTGSPTTGPSRDCGFTFTNSVLVLGRDYV